MLGLRALALVAATLKPDLGLFELGEQLAMRAEHGELGVRDVARRFRPALGSVPSASSCPASAA